MKTLADGTRLTYDNTGKLRAANCPSGNTCCVWLDDGTIHPDYADPSTEKGARAAAFLARVPEGDRPLFDPTEVFEQNE